MAELDEYHAAFKRDLEHLAAEAAVPMSLIAQDPWNYPDWNPFPRFTFLRLRRR